MGTLAVCALLILVALAGGYLLGHGTGTPRCIICGKPLARVCAGGRCGGRPGRLAINHGVPVPAEDDPDGPEVVSGWTNDDETIGVQCVCGFALDEFPADDHDEMYRQFRAHQCEPEDAIEHPAWCHRRGCANRGWHESYPIRCNADPAWDSIEYHIVPPDERRPETEPSEVLIVRVVLTQSIRDGRALPHVGVEIVFYDVPEDREAILLTPLQGQMVAAAIPTLLAIGGQR